MAQLNRDENNLNQRIKIQLLFKLLAIASINYVQVISLLLTIKIVISNFNCYAISTVVSLKNLLQKSAISCIQHYQHYYFTNRCQRQTQKSRSKHENAASSQTNLQYNSNNIPFYSMKIQTCFTSSPNTDLPPVRPLEGYFRFRQEMMNALHEDQRTCENIVKLWNALSHQEKTTRAKQAQVQIDQYQLTLNLWKANQQAPLRSLENEPFKIQTCDLETAKKEKEESTKECQNDQDDVLVQTTTKTKRKSIRKIPAHILSKKESTR